MIRFPKIGQFRNVVKHISVQTSFVGLNEDGEPIYDGTRPKPTLSFRGTVKLHGSNASVVLNKDGTLGAQSRNRVLSIESDNAGFGFFALEKTAGEVWTKLISDLLDKAGVVTEGPVVLFGEWAGGNIQGGVALSELPKMFVAFGLRVGLEEDSKWVDIRPYGSFGLDELSIYSIYDERFPVYQLDINFESPGAVQNEMVEITEAVEKQCPVSFALGSDGIGEGVVWMCEQPEHFGPSNWFKVKGKEHSASKVKTLAPVDVEKVKSELEFVARTVTKNRCLQGIEYLKEQGLEVSQKSTGAYIKWITGDIIREELDVLAESGLEPRSIAKPIGTAAREWYFTYLQNEAGL